MFKVISSNKTLLE